MDDTIEIQYEADDGYVGKSRPQSFTFFLSDLEYCDTVEEAMKIIDDATQEDFEQKISWYIRNHDEIESKVMTHLQSRKDDE